MKFYVGNILTQAVPPSGDKSSPEYEALCNTLRFKEVGAKYAVWKANARFKSEGKKYRWDGYQYLIKRGNGRFHTGFLQDAWSALEEKGIKLELEDMREGVPSFREDFVSSFDTENGTIELRDYQIEAVKAANRYVMFGKHRFYYPRGILNAATNTGKTVIAAGVVKNIVDARVIYLVHREELFRQSVEFFSGLFDVGYVASQGRIKLTDFIVATPLTLHRQMQLRPDVADRMRKCNVLIVDECHCAGAKKYAEVVEAIPAGARFFVSGTPLDSFKNINKHKMRGLCGDPFYTISNQDLIDKDVSQSVQVHMVHHAVPKGFADFRVALQLGVHESTARAEAIYQILQEHSDKRVLLSYREINHGRFLENYVRNRCKEEGKGLDLEVIHAKTANRHSALERFKKGDISVLFTSTILQEGVNIFGIEVLIYAQAGKSPVMLKQFIGRGLRKGGALGTLLLYDFYDDDGFQEPLYEQSEERLALYKSEGFPVIEQGNS